MGSVEPVVGKYIHFSIFVFAALATVARAEIITVDIQVREDGKDDLILSRRNVQWRHYDWSFPGEDGGHHEPTWIQTSVNGRRVGSVCAWHPVWLKPTYSEPATGLTRSLDSALLLNIEVIRARGSLALVQIPNRQNHDTTIVRFDDDGPLGADYYQVRLTYWKPSRKERKIPHHWERRQPAPFQAPMPLAHS